tara:strand:+ start:389 stop:1012 length:624 start_codon:yes stop_codon:yes gene_type:complete
MKNILKYASVLLIITSCTQTGPSTNATDAQTILERPNSYDSLIIDNQKSTLFWKGTKPTGDIHVGTVKIKEGTLNISGESIVGGKFIIDMNSILVTDKDMSEKGKSKLKKHLTNDDFFETNNYPEAILEITSSTSDSLEANLKIKNITKSITIPYSLAKDNGEINANSSFSIDRTLWGVTYKSSFFKNLTDRLIDDAIQFDIELIGS